MLVWRISKKDFANTAFSGYGGLKAQARWNHSGNRIVYTAQSLSLAALEIWVHVNPKFPVPSYVSFSAEIPDDLEMYNVQEKDLPADWKRPNLHPLLQDLGTAWLISCRTVVARVPSVTTPGEFNYLLNPQHPDFARIVQGPEESFQFDPRMRKSRL